MAETTAVRTDVAWKRAAGKWIMAKDIAEDAALQLAKARDKLVELGGDASAAGCGVKVNYHWQTGTVDTPALAQAAGLNPDDYRKPGGYQHRVGRA